MLHQNKRMYSYENVQQAFLHFSGLLWIIQITYSTNIGVLRLPIFDGDSTLVLEGNSDETSTLVFENIWPETERYSWFITDRPLQYGPSFMEHCQALNIDDAKFSGKVSSTEMTVDAEITNLLGHIIVLVETENDLTIALECHNLLPKGILKPRTLPSMGKGSWKQANFEGMFYGQLYFVQFARTIKILPVLNASPDVRSDSSIHWAMVPAADCETRPSYLAPQSSHSSSFELNTTKLVNIGGSINSSFNNQEVVVYLFTNNEPVACAKVVPLDKRLANARFPDEEYHFMQDTPYTPVVVYPALNKNSHFALFSDSVTATCTNLVEEDFFEVFPPEYGYSVDQMYVSQSKSRYKTEGILPTVTLFGADNMYMEMLLQGNSRNDQNFTSCSPIRGFEYIKSVSVLTATFQYPIIGDIYVWHLGNDLMIVLGSLRHLHDTVDSEASWRLLHTNKQLRQGEWTCPPHDTNTETSKVIDMTEEFGKLSVASAELEPLFLWTYGFRGVINEGVKFEDFQDATLVIDVGWIKVCAPLIPFNQDEITLQATEYRTIVGYRNGWFFSKALRRQLNYVGKTVVIDSTEGQYCGTFWPSGSKLANGIKIPDAIVILPENGKISGTVALHEIFDNSILAVTDLSTGERTEDLLHWQLIDGSLSCDKSKFHEPYNPFKVDITKMEYTDYCKQDTRLCALGDLVGKSAPVSANNGRGALLVRQLSLFGTDIYSALGKKMVFQSTNELIRACAEVQQVYRDDFTFTVYFNVTHQEIQSALMESLGIEPWQIYISFNRTMTSEFCVKFDLTILSTNKTSPHESGSTEKQLANIQEMLGLQKCFKVERTEKKVTEERIETIENNASTFCSIERSMLIQLLCLCLLCLSFR